MRTDNPAYVVAAVDQYEAARDVAAAIPWLSPVLTHDALIERALLKTAEWPWPFDGHLGHGFLRYRAEVTAQVPILPGDNVRESLHDPAEVACDRCEVGMSSVGWVLLATGPHLVALAVCGDCSDELHASYAPVNVITKEQTHA